MEPFTVRETVRMDALNAKIVAREERARKIAATRKLGIGVHVAPGGFYAITVFYIPIEIGFSISF